MKATPEDTICAMQVVTIASRDKIEPSKLSCRSVTVAIPTPKRRTVSATWTFLLQIIVQKVLIDKLITE